MILQSLEIPAEEPQRIEWLDQRLVSNQLPDLVAELLALLDLPLKRPAELPSIADWLGNRRTQFLAKGVAAFDEEQRNDLVSRPWLMLDLQAAIDAEGGQFWHEVAESSPESVAARERLRVALGLPAKSPEAGPRSVTRIRHWLTLGVTAAAVVFLMLCLRAGMNVGPPPIPGATGWGWNEAQLFAGAPSGPEYLALLADAGAKWHKQRPETKADVSRRIREMRAGCQRLIDREHTPLGPEQSLALQELCRKWAGDFDAVLADLEADRKTPLEARDAMDGIVDKLVARLRSGKLT